MNRFTKSVGLVTKVLLVGSSVALLGAACWKGAGTNTNVGVENDNVGVNENTNTVVGSGNGEVNANIGTNTNTNTNSMGEVDTSDWLTYTNEEYGFSFRYPEDWAVTGNNLKTVRVATIPFEDMPKVAPSAPKSTVSPVDQETNIKERNNLTNGDETLGEPLVVNSTPVLRYIGLIEGGAITIEYVFFIDELKVSLSFQEGDNSEYAAELEQKSRQELLNEYISDQVENLVLLDRLNTFEKIVASLKVD